MNLYFNVKTYRNNVVWGEEANNITSEDIINEILNAVEVP